MPSNGRVTIRFRPQLAGLTTLAVVDGAGKTLQQLYQGAVEKAKRIRLTGMDLRRPAVCTTYSTTTCLPVPKP